MNAQVHDINEGRENNFAAADTLTSPPSPPKSGGGGESVKQTFPYTKKDTLTMSRTVTTAIPIKKIKGMLTTFMLLGCVFFLTEFGASVGAQFTAAKDGFGQFNGNPFAIVCLALLTSSAFVVISLLWGTRPKKGEKAIINKVVAVLIYIVVWVFLIATLAPEVMPKVRQLVESFGAGGVFAGSDVASTAGNSWLVYALLGLVALLFTAPGLLLVWAKLNYTRWLNIRDTRDHAERLLAIDARADAHKAQAQGAEKAATHFDDPAERNQTNTSALRGARDNAIAWAENKRKQSVAMMHDVMTSVAEKAALYSEIQRLDKSLIALRALTI